MKSLRHIMKAELRLLKKNFLQIYGHAALSPPVSCESTGDIQLSRHTQSSICCILRSTKHLLRSKTIGGCHPLPTTIEPLYSIQKRHYTHSHQDKNIYKPPGELSVHQLSDEWTDRLNQFHIPEAETSAELIIAHAMGQKMFHQVDNTLVPSDEQIKYISEMMEKRKERMPVQYIIEEWDFCDMTLKMRPPVFIPRSETEELAELVCRKFVDSSNNDFRKFLEIGCGSGAISIFVLRALADTKGVAVDISPAACSLTEENAVLHQVSDRLTVKNLDIFSEEAVHELTTDSGFDVIVSNPPYILTEDMSHLQEEIIRYEDHGALDGDKDGLGVVRRILDIAPSLLRTGGHLWLEVGLIHPGQIKAETECNRQCGLEYIATYEDFTNRERFCHLRKK